MCSLLGTGSRSKLVPILNHERVTRPALPELVEGPLIYIRANDERRRLEDGFEFVHVAFFESAVAQGVEIY